MHPTPDEQLQGALRQLDAVSEGAAAVGELSAPGAETLQDAIRLLRRLSGSWPARYGFLTADNQAMAALLELAPPADQPTETEAHALNKQLRELLAETVRALPPEDPARIAIARFLRNRVAADPGLHRNPRPYHEEPHEPAS